MSYQQIENLKNNNKSKDIHKIVEKDPYFEILATDTTGKVFIKNEESFCYNLISNNELWIKPEIKPGDYIIDDSKGIRLQVKKNLQDDTSSGSSIKQVFVVTVNGKFDNLEPFRIPLLKYLKTLNFESLYVLEDHISQKIAQSIYPGIYKAESFLIFPED